MKNRKFFGCLNLIVTTTVLLSLVAGCATGPVGPTVTVMPSPGKPLDLFTQEQKECEDFAFKQMGGQEAIDSANRKAVAKGIFGAILGTATGAVLGSAFGNAGQGSGIGAAAGILGGSAAGTNSSARSNYEFQRLYDIAYTQCMSAKGNQVPGTAQQSPSAMAAPGPVQTVPPEGPIELPN